MLCTVTKAAKAMMYAVIALAGAAQLRATVIVRQVTLESRMLIQIRSL
jgi:hypothetical protein